MLSISLFLISSIPMRTCTRKGRRVLPSLSLLLLFFSFSLTALPLSIPLSCDGNNFHWVHIFRSYYLLRAHVRKEERTEKVPHPSSFHSLPCSITPLSCLRFDRISRHRLESEEKKARGKSREERGEKRDSSHLF